MLLDIQGAGFNLTDPELSSQKQSIKSQLLFCCCNQGMKAFIDDQDCNQYCDMLGLGRFTVAELADLRSELGN